MIIPTMQHQTIQDINTFFDKVFYINLKRDTARNQSMIQMLHSAGITNYERIEAIELTEMPDRGYP